MLLIKRLIAELKNNMRLRVGVAIVVGIVWLYLILVMHDWYRDKMSEYDSLAEKAMRLKSVAGETGWMDRLKSAKAMQAEFEDGLWKNATLGLAQAGIQDWLNQRFAESGVMHPSVVMAENSDEGEGVPSDLWKIKAKLVFDFNPQTLNSLMIAMEKNRNRIIFESLHIYKEPMPRVEAVIVAYCQKTGNDKGGGK